MRNYDYLLKAHQRAADKIGAVIGNFGWVTSDDAIISKTNKGKLMTHYPEHKGDRYIHEWYDLPEEAK
jgi:hypothetical protein